MEIVASQSGDFARDKGRQVAETLLQAHPEATSIYAHNDEMAMRRQDRVKPPSATRIGRKSFDAIERYGKGETIEPWGHRGPWDPILS